MLLRTALATDAQVVPCATCGCFGGVGARSVRVTAVDFTFTHTLVGGLGLSLQRAGRYCHLGFPKDCYWSLFDLLDFFLLTKEVLQALLQARLGGVG